MRFKGRKMLTALVAVFALGAVAAAPALAAGKPLVETGEEVTELGETSATLHGVVDPNGAETKYWFEYGTSTSYGTKTPEATLAAGTSGVEVSKAITGLTKGTTYDFRIVAKNSYGKREGENASFKTKELPEFMPGKGEAFPIDVEDSLHSGYASLEGTFSLGSCSADRTTGEITGAKAASLTLEFTGCGKGTTKVNSKGAASGVIVIPGSGSLVFINKAKEQVGILFKLKEEVTLEAGAEKLKLNGDLVFPITPINTEAFSFALPIHQAMIGSQEYRSYENEKGETQGTSLTLELGGNYQAESIEVTGSNEVRTNRALTVKG